MPKHATAFLSLALFGTAIVVSGGCAPNGGSQNLVPGGASAAHRHHGRRDAGPDPAIKHVVIIIQENRSFNTIFGGPNPFPNADTTDVGYEHDGTAVTLKKTEFESGPCDIDHSFKSGLQALNPNPPPFGTYQMNGYDLQAGCYSGIAGKLPYKYLDYTETKPYWFMASHYALGDDFFPTEIGPSFTAHLNLIAGTDELRHTRAAVNFPSDWAQNPTDCESNASQNATVNVLYPNRTVHSDGDFPCFWQFHTMADLLDEVTLSGTSLSWRYYAPTVKNLGGEIWSEFDAIEKVRCGTNVPITSKCSGTGTDWANVVTPANKILTDIKDKNFLANVTWVVPTYINSDHAGCNGFSPSGPPCTGPSWVASIVNAIGKSSFWNSTVIVVTWDDWGGWYDGVAPPDYDYRGKGIRTPVIVISPYNKQNPNTYYYGGHGWLSHKQYEPGSILQFIEDAFNMKTLSSLPCDEYYSFNTNYNCNVDYTDSTATNDIGNGTLDFTQTPRPFTPIPTPKAYDLNYFEAQSESADAPDNQ